MSTRWRQCPNAPVTQNPANPPSHWTQILLPREPKLPRWSTFCSTSLRYYWPHHRRLETHMGYYGILQRIYVSLRNITPSGIGSDSGFFHTTSALYTYRSPCSHHHWKTQHLLEIGYYILRLWYPMLRIFHHLCPIQPLLSHNPLLQNWPPTIPGQTNQGRPAPSMFASRNTHICNVPVFRPQRPSRTIHSRAHKGIIKNTGHHFPAPLGSTPALLTYSESISPCPHLEVHCVGLGGGGGVMTNTGRHVMGHGASTGTISDRHHICCGGYVHRGMVFHLLLHLPDIRTYKFPVLGTHGRGDGEALV